jgi:hypothetical protein
VNEAVIYSRNFPFFPEHDGFYRLKKGLTLEEEGSRFLRNVRNRQPVPQRHVPEERNLQPTAAKTPTLDQDCMWDSKFVPAAAEA